MFYDEAKILVTSGAGGNGASAFRREKYVPRGGPSGGDGGRGGSVILRADPSLATLIDFRYRRHFRAKNGGHGQGKNWHGPDGADLIIKVPVGTVIRDADSGELLADLDREGAEAVVAAGGRGGLGNAHFATSVNRAPTYAQEGGAAEERWLKLELKLLADVGLIGLPNAGKSSLLARSSAAQPKIGDYPFTTLAPNLGVVSLGEGRSFVMADIPGLIAGAHTGAGLGLKFLRHIERTRLLVHVLDLSAGDGAQVLANWETVNAELKAYKAELAELPQIIAANKTDLPAAAANLEHLTARLGDTYPIMPISAATGAGVPELLIRIERELRARE